MYAEYGLGTSTRETRRMMAEAMFGTRAERRAAQPADRPLSAMVADYAMPAAVEIDQVDGTGTPEMQLLPVGAAQGLGELVAANAEMTLGGQEG